MREAQNLVIDWKEKTRKKKSLVYKMRSLQLLILLVIIVQPIFPWFESLATAQALHKDCLEKCGNIEIPYPFGTREGCYVNSDFFMNCTKDASGSPLLLLRKSTDLKVTNIYLDGQLKIMTFIGKDCYYRNGSRNVDESGYASITLFAFPLSDTQNKLVAIGCDTQASITSGDARTGCLSECGNQSVLDIAYDGTCSGLGCCQTTIPKNLLNYIVYVTSFSNHTNIWGHNPCSYVFLAENSYFNFLEGDLQNRRNISRVPTVLDWAIGNKTCENATNTSGFACHNNSKCIDSTNGPGYRCICLEGFQGNPYKPDGCQDVNECEPINPCGENNCSNTVGNYTCHCNVGYEGNAKIGGGGCEKIQLPVKATSPVTAVTVGIVASLTGFIIVVSWLYWGFHKRKHMLIKKKYFEQNGGLMLRRELSKMEGYEETARIFSAKELKLATNNYDESRIIGQGGFGTVYKGIQDNDPDKVIAIKKSKVMDQDQIEQFINEVIVLSQINHRNVVRLIGCCLEMEVPLLVYEYINNGTLHDHLHKKESSVLSWENRLRIAAEIAGVLAYLHSDAAVSIVHRDIKSANILLDQNCIAKVSDFGASRLVPQDQDHLSTMVQGTMGYLDPEYLHTSLLTEKSDVYSFGVVLIELMTGKKALAFDRPEEERCLAMYFILSMKKNNLFSIIEDGLVKDGNKILIEEVARLAVACLRVSGEERPSMREVASELQGLLATGKHPWEDSNLIEGESKHLLLDHQQLTEFILTDTANCKTSVRCGSITGHAALSVEDGR